MKKALINLFFAKPSSHHGLGGHLIVQSDARDAVFVEIRAERWSPDGSPSYEIYCAEAKVLIGISF